MCWAWRIAFSPLPAFTCTYWRYVVQVSQNRTNYKIPKHNTTEGGWVGFFNHQDGRQIVFAMLHIPASFTLAVIVTTFWEHWKAFCIFASNPLQLLVTAVVSLSKMSTLHENGVHVVVEHENGSLENGMHGKGTHENETKGNVRKTTPIISDNTNTITGP